MSRRSGPQGSAPRPRGSVPARGEGAWIPMRQGLRIIALVSVALGLFVGWQIFPVGGLGEAVRWSLLAAGSIWLVFALAFGVSRFLRKR